MATNEVGWSSVSLDYELEEHDLRLSLTIKNFLDYVLQPGKKLETRGIECAQRCGIKWTLMVYPYGDSEDKKDNIGVYLKSQSNPFEIHIVSVKYEIYLLGKCGKKLNIVGPHDSKLGFELGRGLPKMITRSEIASNKDLYLPNGHLTVRCEAKVSVFLDKPSKKRKIEMVQQTHVSNTSSSVLRKMYEDSICSDVTLKAGSSEFKCHKTILATTSNYFKAMFQHDMKENRENVVDLSKDLKEEELKAMLEYIYLGKLEFADLPQVSLQTLYRVSDMYEIQGMAELCETELIGQLNLENVKKLTVFAIEYGADRLLKAAAAIIINGL